MHLDKGCYRGQETVARVHNLGRPPRMLVLLHLDGSGDRPATGRSGAGRRACRSAGWAPWSTTSTSGPIALALVKRGIPADTPLTTGGEHQVAAEIDPDSLPPADGAGAGRLAVERLRGRRAGELMFTMRPNGPASTSERGTVKCWQDNNRHTDRSRLNSGRSVIARGGSPMGRGRAKAKQTKVARELKYSSPQIDFDRLRKELAGSGGSEPEKSENGFVEDSWTDEDDWRP